MNALAIDSASQYLTVAAQKGPQFMELSLEMGLRQAERLMPAVDYLMSTLNLTPGELDCTAVTRGPGSFTGLRLSLATLKALTLSHGIPLYGLGTLDVYALPYRTFGGVVLSLVQSKDAEFFCGIYDGGILQNTPQALDAQAVLDLLPPRPVLVTGQGAEPFMQETDGRLGGWDIAFAVPQQSCGKAMLRLLDEQVKAGATPLADYDGPLYYKKSEAELVRERTQQAT